MPKRTSKKKGPSRKNESKGNANSQNFIYRECVRFYDTVDVSATSGTVTIKEQAVQLLLLNMGDRAVALADIFSQWRVNSIQIHLESPGPVSYTATLAVNFCGNALFGVYYTPLAIAQYQTPSTFPQIVDFPKFVWGQSGRKHTLSVSKRDISSPFEWLVTNPTGTTDPSLYQSGTIGYITRPLSSAPSAYTFPYVVSYHLEFKTPTDIALLPLYRSLRTSDPNSNKALTALICLRANTKEFKDFEEIKEEKKK
jgi:hypothetical protein